jgi:hypothetical protein
MKVALPCGARIQSAEVSGGTVRLDAWVPVKSATEYREFIVLPGALGIGPGRDLRLVAEFPSPTPPHVQQFLFEDKTPYAPWPNSLPPEYSSERRLTGSVPDTSGWDSELHPRRHRNRR